MTHANALDDDAWYLTGDEGTSIGCTVSSMCTFDEILTDLEAARTLTRHHPPSARASTSDWGPGLPAIETAVDAFVLNGNVFDFEPNGVFVTPTP